MWQDPIEVKVDDAGVTVVLTVRFKNEDIPILRHSLGDSKKEIEPHDLARRWLQDKVEVEWVMDEE